MFLFLSLKNSLNEIIGEDTVGEDDDKDEEDVEDEDVSLSSVALAMFVPIAVSLPKREKSEGSGKPDDSPETLEISSDAEIEEEEDEDKGGGGRDPIIEKSMDTFGRGV